jgi:hypothetical protein
MGMALEVILINPLAILQRLNTMIYERFSLKKG